MDVKICDFCGKVLDPKNNTEFHLYNERTEWINNPKINIYFDLCKECRMTLINRIEQKIESTKAATFGTVQKDKNEEAK